MNQTVTLLTILVLCLISSVESGKKNKKRGTGASCKDHHPKCIKWASLGECDKNPKWMLEHCKQSCGKCSMANVFKLSHQASNQRLFALKLLAGILLSVATLIVVKLYFGGAICRSTAKLNGKTVIITGATSGIGKETARDLAWRKAHVILACRNVKKGLDTAVEIMESSGNKNVEVRKLDLASFHSVCEFAEEINNEVERIDILINNAGCGGLVSKTKDNMDSVFQVNYLSHFLLTNLLLDKLKASAPNRIINVCSIQHAYGEINFEDLFSEKRYKGWIKAYSNTKLAQMLFTMELSKKLEGSGVTVNALHPGLVKTEFNRHLKWLTYFPIFLLYQLLTYIFFKTPIQGAQTSIYCAVAPELEGVTGSYFKECAVAECSEKAKDEGVAKKLWEISETLTNLNNGK